MSNQGFRVGAPNAESIARRRAAIDQWQGSPTDNIDLEKEKVQQIQFQRKFMFLDSVIQQDAEEVQRLLSLGVDVNYTNTDGISALHQVCIDGNAEVAEILLQNKPNINAPDNDGWTPLHAAAQCGFTDLARILLEAGADVACVDNEGQLPIDKAEEDDMRQLLAGWMRRKAINLEQVRTAEERSLREACEHVIRSRNKTLDVVTVDGATILHCAAAKGLPDCIEMLARAGLSVDVQDFDGWTPLHAAAKWAQPEAIDSLIENGADIHTVNTFAETPLDIADEDVIDMLREYYQNNTARSKPIVPGVEKFLKPHLPDAKSVNGIMKGARKLRENKENRPEKLPKPEPPTKIEPKKVEPPKRVEPPKKVEVPKRDQPPKNEVPNKRSSRFLDREPAAAVESKPVESKPVESKPVESKPVENKPGPAKPAWQPENTAPQKEVPKKEAERKESKRAPPPTVTLAPAAQPPASKMPDADTPTKKPSIMINSDEKGSDKAEVVRKAVSRRKRDERRSTQAVTLEDINASKEGQSKPTKEPASLQRGNSNLSVEPSQPAKPRVISNGPSEQANDNKKARSAPVPVTITDTGAMVFENSMKQSPENETPSPTNTGTESAANSAEIVRKKVARRKREDRRSTQHVSKDDMPGEDKNDDEEDSVDTSTMNSKDKEDHLSKELELERKRYNESAEALTRNQEDLRKREVKISGLEKENEGMKKKIADLEEDLRRLQQVNSDNQRLRDENAALIRVIGKLSRNPL